MEENNSFFFNSRYSFKIDPPLTIDLLLDYLLIHNIYCTLIVLTTQEENQLIPIQMHI